MRSNGSVKNAECWTTPAPRPGCMSWSIPADSPVSPIRQSVASFPRTERGPSSIASDMATTVAKIAGSEEQGHAGVVAGGAADDEGVEQLVVAERRRPEVGSV